MGIFLSIQNNLKIRGSACVSQPRSSAHKVKPKLFCVKQFNALDDYIASVSIQLNNGLQSVPQCNDASIHLIDVSSIAFIAQLFLSALDSWRLMFGPRIFLGFVGSPTDFFFFFFKGGGGGFVGSPTFWGGGGVDCCPHSTIPVTTVLLRSLAIT